MKVYDRIRLAAYLDSEGGRIEIRVERNIRLNPVLIIRHREPEVISILKEKYGGEGKAIEKGANAGKNIWRCEASRAIDIAKLVRSSLLSPTKQRQADLLMELEVNEDGAYLTETGRNKEIVEEMRELSPNSRPAGV